MDVSRITNTQIFIISNCTIKIKQYKTGNHNKKPYCHFFTPVQKYNHYHFNRVQYDILMLISRTNVDYSYLTDFRVQALLRQLKRIYHLRININDVVHSLASLFKKRVLEPLAMLRVPKWAATLDWRYQKIYSANPEKNAYLNRLHLKRVKKRYHKQIKQLSRQQLDAHSRINLAILYLDDSKERYYFTGRFIRYGLDKRTKQPTMLVKDVRHHNQLVASHVWLGNLNKIPPLIIGRRIHFSANVRKYWKNEEETIPFVDYQLINIKLK